MKPWEIHHRDVWRKTVSAAVSDLGATQQAHGRYFGAVFDPSPRW
jgi:hypothetical protein